MKQLDLAVLQTFTTIAECRSLAEAAIRLHKSQAAISIQLKNLELLVGKRLIDRGHQTAELTTHGELLLQYARKMIALGNEALEVFLTEEVSGVVRFGLPDDYASAFLPGVLRHFTELYPNVQLKIRNDISRNLFTALEAGELDLALVTHRQGDNEGEILRCDPLQWVAVEGFKLQPGRPLPLALYPHGCGYRRRILSALSSSGREYEIAFECTGVKGVELAVESGLAIAATAAPLIQPGWQVLDTEFLCLPPLGNAMTELRRGRGESTAAVQYFAQNLINRVAG